MSESEPNDSADTANRITPGASVRGSVDAGGDSDWFAFQATAGATINATLTAGSRTNDFKLYTRDGNFVGDTDVSGTARIGTTARYTGTYYVRVSRDNDESGGTYTVTVETFRTDSFEPNEAMANATALSVGSSQSGVVSRADADWFRFEAQRGQTINATLTAGPTANDFKLYTRGGNFVGDTDVSGTASIGTTAQYSGVYYVRVSRDNPRPGSEYSLTVDTYETDAFEPNEAMANATAIEVGSSQSGVVSRADADWFRFEAQAGQTINATMTAGPTANDFKLYTHGGNFVGDTDVSATASIGTTAQYSGTYYVRVSRDNPRPGSAYTFTVETYETDGFEPNEAMANATAIDSGEEIGGRVSLSDTDWFAIEVEAGATINATVTAGPTANDVKLYDRNGSFVADTDVQGTRTLSATAAYSGTYFVRVTTDSGRPGSDYDLEVVTTGGGEASGGGAGFGPFVAFLALLGLALLAARR